MGVFLPTEALITPQVRLRFTGLLRACLKNRELQGGSESHWVNLIKVLR